jgi:hypothetical protein
MATNAPAAHSHLKYTVTSIGGDWVTPQALLTRLYSFPKELLGGLELSPVRPLGEVEERSRRNDGRQLKSDLR